MHSGAGVGFPPVPFILLPLHFVCLPGHYLSTEDGFSCGTTDFSAMLHVLMYVVCNLEKLDPHSHDPD